MAASSTLRVISCLPSATDTVAAMNLHSVLIGRSHECDAEGTLNLPVCTEAKYGLDEGLSTAEIHVAASTVGSAMWEASFGGLSRISMLIEWGLSPYRTDPHKLHELQPDVVLTQVQQCGGAVSCEEMAQALHEWVGKPVTIVHLDPQRLSEVWTDIERIGAALRETEKAKELVSSLLRRMELVKKASMGRVRRRVMCVQWMEPLFFAGAWVPELVNLAGGRDVAHETNETDENFESTVGREETEGLERTTGVEKGLGVCGHGTIGGSLDKAVCELCKSSTEISVDKSLDSHPAASNASWDLVKILKPNSLVFAICGCGLEESVKEVKKIIEKGVLREFSSRIEGAVVDANKLFSRPGPTLVESLEVLAEVLHPEVQSFGHLGKSWRSLELSTSLP